MLEGLLGGLISPEAKAEAINDIIQGALEDNAEQLGVNHSDLFIMIKPKNDKFEFNLMLYRTDKGSPTPVREIDIKELLE